MRDISRVLAAGGRFCLAVVHPLNSAGKFAHETADSPFLIADSYLEPHRYVDAIEPMEPYFRALEAAGFLVETVREVTVNERAMREPRDRRWSRIPLFLHVRAVKPAL